ncbi:MAG: hypothetical protein E3K37_09120 [Candidatus Kuenenia sp.]|nr:hypothetical protein [Candidatus Kuenenia hertensis]
MEQLIGKIVSLSRECAEVCVIDAGKLCGNCSVCFGKNGTKNVVKVSPIKNAKIGQLVVLRDNRNWINKNKVFSLTGSFVFGVILTEVLFKIMPLEVHRSEYDFIGGGILIVIMMILIRITKPNYFFKMELYGEKKT